MRRPALLIAGATLWLFLAAIPVLADGGVHVADNNSGYSTLTADSCAGCHRAHTAQGAYLLKTASVDGLCLSCHGAASTGATTDVMTGIQYALAGSGDPRDTNTIIGALRNGGFDQARIDTSNPGRYSYYRTATDLSARPVVRAAANPVDVTSSHLALTENGLTAKGTLWGNGAAGSGVGATNVELECTNCHNPHGNGQYRILNDLPAVTGTGFVDPVPIAIDSVSATTDRFTTTRAHGFVVGDIVTISGVTGATPSFSTATQYIVTSVPNGVTFQVAAAPTKTSADITGTPINITAGGTGGTVQRFSTIVDDAPLPSPTDVRNYSIMEVRGYQGNSATYLLYASQVLAARTANGFDLVADIVGLTASNDRFVTGLAHGFALGDSVTIAGGTGYDGSYTIAGIPNATSFTVYATGSSGPLLNITADATATGSVGDKLGTATKFVAGTFSATSGDYFHRAVPWNPQGVNPACTYATFTDTSGGANPDYASACLTANDAPNGRPATVAGKLDVNGGTGNITPSAYGQVAFNDQISAWCSACHSRYYSSTNPNPGGEPGSSAGTVRTISGINTTTDVISTTANHGFAVGDVVDFDATPTAPDLSAGTWYVVWVGTGSTGAKQFQVSATYDGPVVDITAYSGGGTVVRLYPASASSWWFPRPGENIFKYQHQTTTNRACVTCHVAHGSPAVMDGTYSSSYSYPDGSTSADSRLLKIDNRGTCQACHDPTGTVSAGTYLPGGAPPSVP